MIEIKSKKECCGCTACSSICPKKCIDMKEDNEGFIYPNVNVIECIDCKLCEQVCPMTKKRENEKGIPESILARDVREKVLLTGTSGSVFTSIMEYVLQKDGVVYGVIVDEEKVVKHIRVDSQNDNRISKIPCSKYVRSEIRDIFPKIKEDLTRGKLVCFSGVPCQVEGLKSYLNRDYKNLLTIDVICHGNPSPLFWEKYVEYLEKKYKSKIVDVRFRNKTFGYHSGTMKVVFGNGKVYFGSARTNYFLKAFFSDLCSRPSCYECNFKHIQHKSDLTLFDGWHASELANIEDDDRGYTNIIIQSNKGKEILDGLKTLKKYPIDTLKAVELDGIMVENSVEWNDKRERFFDNINNENIEEHCLKFMKISLKDKFIEKMKRIYYIRKFNG